MRFWGVYVFTILALLFVISAPAFSSSIMTGAGSVIDKEGSAGKLEACIFTQNKNYHDPSWIKEVMSPISSLADGGAELVQLPVYLIRSFERPLEQGISGKRQDASNCLRYEKRAGESLATKYNIENYKAVSSDGDTVTADNISLKIEISGDTKPQ